MVEGLCICQTRACQTGVQVIKQTLEPVWNETFSIPAAAVQQAMDGRPVLQFEVWGRKQLVKKELLGQVCLVEVTSNIPYPQLVTSLLAESLAASSSPSMS